MNYPKIPLEEYPKRHEKVKRWMAEQGLDVLIAYSDDRATYGAAYARWLANFHTHFEPCLVLFTQNDSPKLLVGPETPGYAIAKSMIEDVIVLKEFTHPGEDYLFTKLYPLKDIVGNSSNVAKVGIAGAGIIDYNLYVAIERAFPGAQMIDVDQSFGMLRAIKTPAEIEVINFAYHLAELGFNAALDAIAPGVTEREVAAHAEFVMRKNGSEGMGIDTIIASGENTHPVLARTTMRQIQKNDMVCVTIAPRYEGYHGAIARPVIVGEIDSDAERAAEVEQTAQEEVAKRLTVGAKGKDAEAAGREIMRQAGFEKYFMYSGIHSIGVIEFEIPIFGPSNEGLIEENMMLSIDIPTFEAPFFGSRTEDGYLIKADGAQRINKTPYQLRK